MRSTFTNRTLKNTLRTYLISACLVCLMVMSAQAQPQKLSGPRLGLTTFSPGAVSEELNTHAITQFGWQLETRFVSGENVMGLIEWVLLAGGFEKGYFLPSVSSIVGARFSSGFELGAGPNLSVAGFGLVAAVGYNFKVGDLNLPINLSWVPSQESWLINGATTGHRVSLTFGFNMSER